jgi:hypothetical protein
MIPAMARETEMPTLPEPLGKATLPIHFARLRPPVLAASFVAPLKWEEDALIKSSKGTDKKRFGSFCAARRMLDCDPDKLRAILKSGLIYAYRGTEARNSWWVIDLAGIYLYRENQRRRTLGLPQAADWAAYSAHMAALNADQPVVTGPPPLE